MLESMEKVNEVRKVVNGVDDPNLLSVDSTNPLPTNVDTLEVVEEKKPEEKKEEKKDENSSGTVDGKPANAEQSVKTVPDNTNTDDKDDKKEDKKEDKKPPEEDKPLRSKDPVQERIDKITKKFRAAERETEFERNKNAKLEEELAKLKSTVVAEDKPKREDFEDVEEYAQALTAWTVKKELATAEAKKVKSTEVDKDKEVFQQVAEKMDAAFESGKDKYDDFVEVVTAKDLAVPTAMINIILETEVADEVMYYLGKNPDEALDIAGLSTAAATRRIMKIEAKLIAARDAKVTPAPAKKDDGTQEPAAKPTPKKVSSAPEPIETVIADGAIQKDPNAMSPKEYRAWRESQKK